VHAHVLTQETIRALQREAPGLGLRLQPLDDRSAVLEVAGITQKPFPRAAWDLEWRLRDMADQQVDVQVVSNVPHTFLYEQEASLAVTCAGIQNDAIASLVKEHPDRFRGLATLPLQWPERAAEELSRAMRLPGMVGAHVGSNVAGRNLDDPDLAPVWAAAHALRAFVLVHPHKVAAGERLKSYYLKNLVGNPLETTIAAASLVFGGVMERYPDIRFCLAHGGGFVPYQAGRFAHGWRVRPEPKQALHGDVAASLGRLYYDTILHSGSALAFLIRSVGADRVLLGSDYPLDMGQFDGVRQVRALPISPEEQGRILGGAAAELLRPAV
jgi:aminocarboxymuconate-semialdehyde decarboxylase